MFKTIFKVVAVLALALGGGIWSVDYALDSFEGFGELRVGAWRAYPAAGTPDADPYSKARAARKAYLPLGTTEGLPFYAQRDSAGRELRRGCTYRLSGFTPPARFWTLYPATPDLKPIAPREGLQSALHSRAVLYEKDGSLSITISPDASPGNWLPVEGRGNFVLVMTLYDTPAGSSSGLSDLVMPSLVRIANQGPKGQRRAVAKLVRLVLLGLIGAAIVHIAIVFLVPVYSDKNAWSRIEASGDPYRFYRLDQKTGPISDSDPLVKEATCRFDLSNGPVHITTQRNVPYWSLSIYAPNGDNLYSLNDNVSNDRKLDLVIADPIGMASLRSDASRSDTRSIFIEQNIGEGAAVLRVFVPDTTWNAQVQRFFDEAQCEPFEGF
ncbi:hypothetical protein C038_00532 [Brucella sp. 63/311]|nr:hypothetical protein C038_00532 [Brucella sp. 63/311]